MSTLSFLFATETPDYPGAVLRGPGSNLTTRDSSTGEYDDSRQRSMELEPPLVLCDGLKKGAGHQSMCTLSLPWGSLQGGGQGVGVREESRGWGQTQTWRGKGGGAGGTH